MEKNISTNDVGVNVAKERVGELDFLKGVLILLVIAFHLVHFSTTYPYAKQVVYTFHMPAFLMLSGYLMNFEKDVRSYLRTLLWLFVPYLIMESGYVIMASILPIREHIDSLTLGVFIDKLLLHPIGPYWYLQTLVICGLLWYALRRWTVWGGR
jgi:fucose 4-O-acetylase-like acetyltransferase